MLNNRPNEIPRLLLIPCNLNFELSIHKIIFFYTFLIYSHLLPAQDGTLDKSFGKDGFVSTNLSYWTSSSCSAKQLDGKILIGGQSLQVNNQCASILRINIDGSLDSSFNQVGGHYLTSIWNSFTDICIQNDGKILAVTSQNNNRNPGCDDPFEYTIHVCRFDSNGTIDNAFGNEGIRTIRFGYHFKCVSNTKIAIRPDSKILIMHKESELISKVFCLSADGEIDSTFGINGSINIKTLSDECAPIEIAVQNEKYFVILTNQYLNTELKPFLSRYDMDGNIDTSFGIQGKQYLSIDDYDNLGTHLTIQSNKKIVLCGTTLNTRKVIFIARYTFEGILDSSWNNTGILNNISEDTDNIKYKLVDDYSIVSDEQDRIILSGPYQKGAEYHLFIEKYLSNGEHNIQFGLNGRTTTQISKNINQYELVIDKDNDFIILGNSIENSSKITFFRLNQLGQIISKPNLVYQLGNQKIYPIGAKCTNDNKIIVCGNSQIGNFVARYLGDGSLDPSFGHLGVVFDILETRVKIISFDVQKDSKIIITGLYGYEMKNVTLRLNTNGQLDSTFGTNGTFIETYTVSTTPISVLTVSDNSVIVGAEIYYYPGAIDRYKQLSLSKYDGAKKLSTKIISLKGLEYINEIRITKENKIIVEFESNINQFGNPERIIAYVRLNADFTRDKEFNNGNILTTSLSPYNSDESTLIQNDGKIVCVTEFTEFNGPPLARYNYDGSRDWTYGPIVYKKIFPSADAFKYQLIQKQQDDKILVSLIINNKYNENNIIRFTKDGHLDLTFNLTGFSQINYPEAYSSPRNISIDTYNRPVVCSSISSSNISKFSLFRLNNTVNVGVKNTKKQALSVELINPLNNGHVILKKNIDQIVEIKLFDIKGIEIAKCSLNKELTELNWSNIHPGLYIVNTPTQYLKFVKQ